jgi:predicted ribosomally synthesized peptide with SipW-like signal peptide
MKKKIGILCLALVLAVGALGIGYAAWTDTITINGNVNTGTVDLVVEKYSGTYIWKTSVTPFYEIVQGWDVSSAPVANAVDAFPNAPYPPGSAGVDPVAYATAAVGAADDTVTVTIFNAFPCKELTADFLLHYNGTIPVKVTVWDITCSDATLDPLVLIKYYVSDANGGTGAEITSPVGMQLHKCAYVKVVISLHLPQDDALQNLSGTITGTITVTQWNEA